MHLRPHRLENRDGGVMEKTLPIVSVETAGVGVAARRTFSKKCLLVVVLLIQVCFIYGFWLLQLDLNMNSTTNDGGDWQSGGQFVTPGGNTKKGVNFIQKTASALMGEFRQSANVAIGQNANEFSKEFIYNRLRPNRKESTTDDEQWWCFREGTAIVENHQVNANFSANWQGGIEPGRCKCAPQWHGMDCGQPEVIWRALMTTKAKFPLRNPSEVPAHRLIHMVEGNFFSLDLLELLLKSVVAVVDHFIIVVRHRNGSVPDFKALEHRLRDTVPNARYSIYREGEGYASTADVYRRFRLRFGEVRPSDLFLYTNDHTILSSQALRFLKYYATDVCCVRFRVKHNVYGFYWQHPQRTCLAGIISSFRHLDDPLAANKDPRQLLRSSGTAHRHTMNQTIIVGDLNHVGGWYCQYCQQPNEIIAELHVDNSSSSRVRFPNVTRSRNVDVSYLETLISNGVHVDGQQQLVKLRRYAERYYAPQYAEGNSWKFGYFLVNLYETFGDDSDDGDNY